MSLDVYLKIHGDDNRHSSLKTSSDLNLIKIELIIENIINNLG